MNIEKMRNELLNSKKFDVFISLLETEKLKSLSKKEGISFYDKWIFDLWYDYSNSQPIANLTTHFKKCGECFITQKDWPNIKVSNSDLGVFNPSIPVWNPKVGAFSAHFIKGSKIELLSLEFCEKQEDISIGDLIIFKSSVVARVDKVVDQNTFLVKDIKDDSEYTISYDQNAVLGWNLKI